jgi:SH3-like domain-containing protein
VTPARAVPCLLFGLLVSCSDKPRPQSSIGDAYVGPSTLNLRQELAPKSNVSATVKHGEKLEILEYKHRLVKVRTAQGVEGWTDMRQLLTPQQMALLRQMADNASQYPSQGTASVYESLNMHTEPNRASPGFWQIPENGKVEVIGHKLTPRVQPASISTPSPPKPASTRRRARDKGSQSKLAPPPPPPAPKPPANWQALSVPKAESAEAEAPKNEQPLPVHGQMEDWSLVRTKDGKVGWVLTRPLSMAIPDEVAQYAEGHRITSYFALGSVREEGVVKNNWLWTTITKGQEPYEFDSFRVFVWSHKHHHYETAYIERNVTGHYPVEVNTSGSVPMFSIVLEGIDGGLYRKTYTFEGFRIRMVKREPYIAPVQKETTPAPSVPLQPDQPSRSWYARMKDRVRRLFH